MQIYPTIRYYDGSEKYTNGTYVEEGYNYAYFNEGGILFITPLREWLNS